MNVAKYLKMNDEEKRRYFEQEVKKPIKEYGFKVSDANSNMSKLFDGEPVNKNPLTDIPIPEKCIYCVEGLCFDTENELVEYC